VNVNLPPALKGRGQLVVTVTVGGQATNMGQLAFQQADVFVARPVYS